MRTKLKTIQWSNGQIAFSVLLAVSLMAYLILIFFQAGISHIPVAFILIRLLAVLIGFAMGKLWKDRGFRILIFLLIIRVIRLSIKGTELFFTDTVSDNIFNCLWAISGCYAIGRVLSIKQIKTFLRICLCAWTIIVMIHCAIALVAAFSFQSFENLAGIKTWGIDAPSGRLLIGNEYSTVAGSLLSITGICALCAVLLEKRKRTKVFYAFAYLIIILAISLADTRTAFYSLSLGVGVVIFFFTHRRLIQKEEGEHRKRSWILAAGCMILASALNFALFMVAPVVAHQLLVRGGLILSAARAEDNIAVQRIAQSRGLTYLSGRDVVWKILIQFICERPKVLLFGQSISDPMVDAVNFMALTTYRRVGHCHNIILQIIMENGIVGLVPVVCFAIYTLKRFTRLLRQKDVPLWIYLIPGVIAVIAVGDMADCFCWFSQSLLPALPVMFIACGIVNSVGSDSIQTDDRRT